MSSGVKRLKTLKVDRSLRMRRLKDCQNRRTERDASLPSVTRTAGRILCLAATRTRRWACGVLNGSAFGSEVGSGCLSAALFEFVATAPCPVLLPYSRQLRRRQNSPQGEHDAGRGADSGTRGADRGSRRAQGPLGRVAPTQSGQVAPVTSSRQTSRP
jgi:hypothetical protein